MLTTHLPFLMGPTMLNLKIDPLIQTSAVTGLGILFAQTGHTNVVNKLLNEGCVIRTFDYDVKCIPGGALVTWKAAELPEVFIAISTHNFL
ncbi:unnamed protein product [Strongylus vulgaris]|uniref:Uncharacterized protein n=1 Tax=Strongylus vulgaris TaxID=40348 RepID=A0A3P7JDP0_STRVU|nr:unnamed protein product [Strongylus vulgaris]